MDIPRSFNPNKARRRTSSLSIDKANLPYEALLEVGDVNRRPRFQSDPAEYPGSRRSNSSFSSLNILLMVLTLFLTCSSIYMYSFVDCPTVQCSSFDRVETMSFSKAGLGEGAQMAEISRLENLLDISKGKISRLENEHLIKDSKIEELEERYSDSESVPEKLKKDFRNSQAALRSNLLKMKMLESKLSDYLSLEQQVDTLKTLINQRDLTIEELKKRLQDDSVAVTQLNEAESAADTNESDGDKNQVSPACSQQMAQRDHEILRLHSSIDTLKEQMKSIQSYGLAKANNQGDGQQGAGKLRGQDSTKEEYDRLVHRDTLLQGRLQRAKKRIQDYARELIHTKYGEGPHYVTITVRFPPEMIAEGQSEVGSFVVEMAPVEYVPHTVYYWLSQMSQGLWNGAAFIRNAPHVIQADPQDQTGRHMISRFRDGHLPLHVAFQEYDQRFPHVKYTLGLPSRPGGPDWYISVEDNSIVHGPNGQLQFDMPEEADPCFAKVVSGFDVVDRIHGLPIRQKTNDLVYHIVIEEAVLGRNMYNERRLNKKMSKEEVQHE